MRSLGYARNEVDICIFNKLNDKRQQCTVCVHVDDLLITSDSKDMLGIAILVCSHHSCLRMLFCLRATWFHTEGCVGVSFLRCPAKGVTGVHLCVCVCVCVDLRYGGYCRS
jgi:hypothetical protein